MLKRQAKQGAAGIQHDIDKLYDLKNDIREPQTIGLIGSQPNDSMQGTFLHELFHAIVHVMDLKETETEENYVRRDFINNGNPQADLRLPDNYSPVSFALHTFLLNLFKKSETPWKAALTCYP